MSDELSSLRIPGFRIVRELGQGGMASVYLAVQESLDREVALKIMSPILVAADAEFSERFVNEGRTIAKLNHPNVVTVHDIAVAEGHHYIAMEYIDGDNLKQKTQKGLDDAEGVAIVKQVAAALGYAHKKGFVHRDIKPDNILLRGDGTAVLTDFGIAKAVGRVSRMTATGMSIGTPHYMSPEQARGADVDARADIYSLGVVLYEILVKEPLFDAGDSFAIGIKHLSEPVPRLPAGLARYQPVLDKMLAKTPDERYPDVETLVEALDALDAPATRDGAAAPTELLTAVGAATTRPSGSMPPWAWAGGAAAALVLAVTVYVYTTSAPAPESIPSTDGEAGGSPATVAAPSGDEVGGPDAAGILSDAEELLETGKLEEAEARLEEARAQGAGEEEISSLTTRIEDARRTREKEIADALESTRESLASDELDAARARLDEARALGAGEAAISSLATRIEDARRMREKEIADALESTRELLASNELDAARAKFDEARALGAGGEAVSGLEQRIQELQTRRSLAAELLVKAEAALQANRLSEAIGHCESAGEFFSGPLANDDICRQVAQKRAAVRQQWEQQNIGSQETRQVE